METELIRYTWFGKVIRKQEVHWTGELRVRGDQEAKAGVRMGNGETSKKGGGCTNGEVELVFRGRAERHS